MKLTSIITVNFNQPDVTLDFLRSIKNNVIEDEVELILVDNGSKTDHGDIFKAVYPNIIYIRSNENLGFAGGNNLGISRSKGDYLLFLNNDTEITGNLIPVLREELELHPEIGIISPLILYFSDPQIIQYAGFTKMNYLTCRNKGTGSMDLDIGQYDNVSNETGYCHGAAMMCRKQDLNEVGLMPEHFFLYYEELDWCEQFKRCGKKIWFTGKTRIFHKESMSVGKESNIKTYFMTRNRMLFIRRNTGFFNTLFFSLYYISVNIWQIIVYFLQGRKDLIKWVFKGAFWNFWNSKDSNRLGFKI